MDLVTNAFVKEKSLLGECGEEKEAKEPPRARYGHLEGDVGSLRNSCRAASGGKLVYRLRASGVVKGL